MVLTPQSLKRKLFFIPADSEDTTTSADVVRSSSTPTPTSAPPHHSLNQHQHTPYQQSLSRRLFSFQSKYPPYPVELLDSQVLSETFLGRKLFEKYFERRHFLYLNNHPFESESEIYSSTTTTNTTTNTITTTTTGLSSPFTSLTTASNSNTSPSIHDSPNKSSSLTSLGRPFVRSAPPTISISAYLDRLFKYCQAEPMILLAIIVYSERLIKLHSRFVPPSGLHRFIVAAWLVGCKALTGDQYWTNQFWSRVAGVSISEICGLEMEFIKLFDWKLQVTPSELSTAWCLIS